MKKLIYGATLTALAFALLPAVAQDDAATTADQEESTVTLTTDEEKLSYSVGFQVGRSLADLPSLDLNVFMSAVQDVLADKAPALTDEEMQASIMSVMTQVREEQQKKMEAERAEAMKDSESRLEANKAWLAENAEKEGVEATASGLQYKVVEEGSGASPKTTDTVTVHYRGTLTDGTQFDSSYDRGEPATFRLDQVIKGWTEGLQLMKEGATYEFFIPSELAYGDQYRPGSPIPPNSVLQFQVELIKVEAGEDGAGGEEVLLEQSN